MKKNKKGIIGGFTITFVSTIVIILILLSYFIFSFVVKEFSSVRSEIETKYKETNIENYFYINSTNEKTNEDSFQGLYLKKYLKNSQDTSVNKLYEGGDLMNSIQINCGNKQDFSCPYPLEVEKLQ